MNPFLDTIRELWTGMGDSPALIFLAFCLLPALPLPISLTLAFFGPLLIAQLGFGPAYSLILVAEALCMSWAYFVSAHPGRKLMLRLLAWRKITLPEFSQGDLLRFLVVFRITPGIPFFLQNIVLGVLRVPFWPYLLLSIPPQALYAFAFLKTGQGLLEGEAAPLVIGLGVLILAAVLVSWLRKKAKQRDKEAEDPSIQAEGEDLP
ncbi:MAG: hypothetical protein AAF555_08200 [Verrucomicrobiota bacterium]